ncbi:MAG: penicillin-binding protein activator [Sinobacteraceae bacterium]|nr:penicillin-binding protein activator [Nevskiaceae bacterium]
MLNHSSAALDAGSSLKFPATADITAVAASCGARAGHATPLRHASPCPRSWPAALSVLLLAAALLLLAGCQSLGGAAAGPGSLQRAEALAQRGEHAAAAREYEKLADDNPGSAGTDYLLGAAREWLAAGRVAEARRVLAQVSGTPSTAQSAELRLLDIELLLAAGEAQRAWQQLEAAGRPREPAAQLRYHALRQKLAFATNRPAEGIRAELAREQLLTDSGAKLQARRELFAQLREASARGIKLEPTAAGGDAIVRGWLELGPIAAQVERGGVAPAIAAWRARNPSHPAAELLRTDFSGPTTAGQTQPGAHVAVLLPISGRNAGAAAQIRDGLLAGYYATPAASRPDLRFYDTGATSVAEALIDAQRAGAEFVIGPLTREEVIAAADATVRRPPLLALNFLAPEAAAPQNFYQYALSPEDEARLVARRALADGRRRAVALVPEGDWGTRVLSAFRSELESGGGQVLDAVSYAAGRNDYSDPIQTVLRLKESQTRQKRLESALGTTLAFQPRRRADIELLFTPAPSATARQLRPQLRFHFAGDLPAYATSDAYEPGLSGNADLDGLLFPDMPWMLGMPGTAERLRSATLEAWGPDVRGRGRLYAFGYDAWLIYQGLRSAGSGRMAPVDGATGRLWLDAERRVRRDLDWAQIRNGLPRALDGAGGT